MYTTHVFHLGLYPTKSAGCKDLKKAPVLWCQKTRTLMHSRVFNTSSWVFNTSSPAPKSSGRVCLSRQYSPPEIDASPCGRILRGPCLFQWLIIERPTKCGLASVMMICLDQVRIYIDFGGMPSVSREVLRPLRRRHLRISYVAKRSAGGHGFPQRGPLCRLGGTVGFASDSVRG